MTHVRPLVSDFSQSSQHFFQSAKEEQEAKKAVKAAEDDQDVSDEEESSFSAGLGFQGSKKKGFGGGKKSFKLNQNQDQGGQIAGLRTSGYQTPVSLGKGFGDWEKHTRGIGAKLLLQV